jgi:hypothetical protein
MALGNDGRAEAGQRRYYKYMSRATGRVVLQDRTLRWSTPATLNDPFDNQFDLHIRIDRELTSARSKAKLWGAYLGVDLPPADTAAGQLVRELCNRRPNLNRFQFESAIGTSILQGLRGLDQYVERMQGEIRPHVARHKLLCLALAGDDIPMWTYYGENHKGVVLCFRDAPGQDSPWSAGKAVRYQQEMPTLLNEEELSDVICGRTHIDPFAVMEKIVFTKSLAWAHEREWRIFSGIGRSPEAPFEDIPFGVAELEAAILGCLMPADDRRAFSELVRNQFPNAELREATRHDRNFELVIGPLA